MRFIFDLIRKLFTKRRTPSQIKEEYRRHFYGL